jgi:CheY-like chemotaxis protein
VFEAAIVSWPVFGASPPSRFSALVVEPKDADRVFIVSTLTSAGLSVTATDNFRDAGALLVAHMPFVLVTEIRLGAYNGLHLALRGRSMRPQMTVVVTSGFPDPVLQREAERLGATFVPKPVTRAELLAAVYRTALRQPNPDGTVEPIRPPFERRHRERRQIAVAGLEQERRYGERRRDAAGLLFRAASHQ